MYVYIQEKIFYFLLVYLKTYSNLQINVFLFINCFGVSYWTRRLSHKPPWALPSPTPPPTTAPTPTLWSLYSLHPSKGIEKSWKSFNSPPTSIELHAHGYVSTPCGRTDSNVASFNDRVEVVINNWISVCVSKENLRETEQLCLDVFLSHLNSSNEDRLNFITTVKFWI